jgi:glycosyltransferase involved in cell wall biosynthesis
MLGLPNLSVMMSIKVTVCCITYNHAGFIRSCIEGFLMQKTTFGYEILIHDDCSTDGTSQIVDEVAERHPRLIRIVRPNVNRYSTESRAIITQYLLPLAQGDYIALCEGDDYWTDPHKLQRQVDFLEKNRDYSASFHSVRMAMRGRKPKGLFRAQRFDGKIPIERVIEWRHRFFATSSLVYRKKVMKGYPDFCLQCHVGDYPLMIWLSLQGAIHYIDQTMSVYRRGHAGSWSKRYLACSQQERMAFLQTELNMLEGFDQITAHRYRDLFQGQKAKLRIYALWRYRDYRALRDPVLRPYYKRLSIGRRWSIKFSMLIDKYI